MIAYLKGKVLEKSTNFIIVENNNIGYKVLTIPEVLETPKGTDVELFTYLKVSDDGQTLFGLPNFDTLQFFELLITVTGVGPKMALTIVSAAKIETLKQAIIAADAGMFTRMSGLGKKTAERIILELKNKVGAGGLEATNKMESDLYDALIALGYNPREVREVMGKVDGNLPMQNQIKEALKFLSK